MFLGVCRSSSLVLHAYGKCWAFSQIKPTSKDCKTLIPVLISFLENFERKYESMFKNMKEEFLSGLAERGGKIDGMELKLYL